MPLTMPLVYAEDSMPASTLAPPHLRNKLHLIFDVDIVADKKAEMRILGQLYYDILLAGEKCKFPW